RFVDELSSSVRSRSVTDIERTLFAETTETELLHPTWVSLDADSSPKPRRVEKFISELDPTLRGMCVVIRGRLIGVRSYDRLIGKEPFSVVRRERQEPRFAPFIALGPAVLCAW